MFRFWIPIFLISLLNLVSIHGFVPPVSVVNKNFHKQTLVKTPSNIETKFGHTALILYANQKLAKQSEETSVIPADYRLSAAFMLGGLGLATAGQNPFAGIPITLLGAALAARTKVVRFAFDDEALEVLTVDKDGDLALSGENFAVGGRNRWKYDTFVNWEFYPSPALPILVYFKENQTKPEGQIHFFPVIMDGKQLYETMKEKIPLDKSE